MNITHALMRPAYADAPSNEWEELLLTNTGLILRRKSDDPIKIECVRTNKKATLIALINEQGEKVNPDEVAWMVESYQTKETMFTAVKRQTATA